MSAQLMSREALAEVLEREHATTLKVLRAFPAEQAGLRPHPTARTALELAFVFALECGLAQLIMQDYFASAAPGGQPPSAPATWEDVIAAVESGHREYMALIRSYDEARLAEPVTFFTAPRTLGKYTRAEIIWLMLFDQIHHRGQFSVYLRMAGAKVPSIYGGSADEPWV